MLAFTAIQNKVATQYSTVSNSCLPLAPELLTTQIIVQRASIRCTDVSKVEAALYDVAVRSLMLLCGMVGRSFATLQSKQREVFSKKNSDYGSSYKATGIVGILIRMIDKLRRLKQLEQGGSRVKTESRSDTLLDLSIYSILGIMILSET